jgi:hypothetical protein
MGIIDDRSLKAYREFAYPRWKEKLEIYLGFPLVLEVQWETLVSPNAPNWYFTHLTEIFFLPLSYAIETFAYDDLGRGAIRNSLKSVVIKNTTENSDFYNMVDFKDGVLSIDHLTDVNIQETYQRAEAILQCLEKNLSYHHILRNEGM